jgi:hypothetical protein
MGFVMQRVQCEGWQRSAPEARPTGHPGGHLRVGIELIIFNAQMLTLALKLQHRRTPRSSALHDKACGDFRLLHGILKQSSDDRIVQNQHKWESTCQDTS